MRDLSVLIGEADDDFRKVLKNCLSRNGFTVCGESSEGNRLLKLAEARRPDVVVVNTVLKGGSSAGVIRTLSERSCAALVVIANSFKHDEFEDIKSLGIPSMHVKPVDMEALMIDIELAYHNHQKLLTMERRIKFLEDKLETRKKVERAKGILMKTLGITEEQAYRMIQKKSMDERTTMASIANAIIWNYEISKK